MNRRRGSIVLMALGIAILMLLWAVAATYRTNFQSGAILFSYRKSEAYYLAKRGISRSLYYLNKKPSWGTTYNSRATADRTTKDTRCWLDQSTPNAPVLRCEATVGRQIETLNVPLLNLKPSSLHIYSVSPSLSGGPDVIAWSTQTSPTWQCLPPIPRTNKILSVCQTPNGDVYAIGETNGNTAPWRYRIGQGWQQMPDVQAGINLACLSNSGNSQLVCRGSNNSVQILSLGVSSSKPLGWNSVTAPAGCALQNVTANPSRIELVYATATNSSGEPAVFQCNTTSEVWKQLPAPAAAGGLNFKGGLTADKNGCVYAACNPLSGPAIVYAYSPASPGDANGVWTTLPAVPALEWTGDIITNPTGNALEISNLRADNEGKLWCQWNSPTTGKPSVISLPALP